MPGARPACRAQAGTASFDRYSIIVTPTGRTSKRLPRAGTPRPRAMLVVDPAYEPLANCEGPGMDVTVSDNPDSSRYEARTADGKLAGFAAYQKTPQLIVFTHTETDSAYEGQGVGSALAAGALDHVRTLGLAVLPLCPFIKAYIGRHREYAELVYSAPPSTAAE